MSKTTLLDMVQEILSDMTSDPVNSISDTYEALQVAKIIKRTYYNIINDRIWPSTGRLLSLTPSGDSGRPTHMRLEDEVIGISWVKYNTRRSSDSHDIYTTVKYKTNEEFLEIAFARDNSKSNVTTVMDYNGTPLFILNDAAPTCYTSFDDKHIIFDSFDSAIDSTLQGSKTQVFGEVEPAWSEVDSFVPDLPSKAFPYLINEAKSTAFIKIKEVFSQKDEQASVRQKGWLSRNKHRIDGDTRYPDYGRKTARGSGRNRRAGYNNNHFTG